MKFKRVSIQFDQDELDYDLDTGLAWWVPVEGEKSAEADKQIEQYLNEGWKIVSTSPVVGTFSYKVGETILPFVVTDGIEVFMVKED